MTNDDLARLRSLAEAATTGHMAGEGHWSDHAAKNPDCAAMIAALDPQTVLALIDAAALGLAWNRVEAALQSDDGCDLSRTHYPEGPEKYYAETWLEDGKAIGSHAPTPTAALLALAEKLEARK